MGGVLHTFAQKESRVAWQDTPANTRVNIFRIHVQGSSWPGARGLVVCRRPTVLPIGDRLVRVRGSPFRSSVAGRRRPLQWVGVDIGLQQELNQLRCL